jgi:hypothetical protein
MFELSDQELEKLRSHFGTSSWGGVRYSPMAFTEPGVAMLSSILNSDRAISVYIHIIRIFIRLREMLISHADLLNEVNQVEHLIADHDDKILLILEYLKQLEQAKQQQEEQ